MKIYAKKVLCDRPLVSLGWVPKGTQGSGNILEKQLSYSTLLTVLPGGTPVLLACPPGGHFGPASLNDAIFLFTL